MMRYMRSGFMSGFFIVFLVLGGFSLVLTDWTGSFRSGVTSHDVAKIGRERIGMIEFQNLVQRNLRSQNIPPQQAYQMGLINQILTTEIWTRMLDHAARGYGISAGDDLLSQHLLNMAAPVAKSDNASPAKVIKQYIESQGLTESGFLTVLRRELNTNTLRTTITGPAEYVSPLIQRDLAAYQQQTRNGQYIILPDDKITDIGAPDEKTLSDYYETKTQNYMQPERRTFRVGTIVRSDLEKLFTPKAGDTRAFYDSHRDELKRAEQRTLSQAIYGAAHEADAKALVAALKKTTDFLETAKKIGAPSSLTTQSYGRDGFLPELADPVFNAKTGDVIGPIKTALGWHVIRVDQIVPAGTPPFDDVKAMIEKQLRDDVLGDMVDARLGALDQAYENGEKLDDVAKINGMTVTTFTNLTRDGNNDKGENGTANMAAAKGPILSAAFTGTETNRISAPIELPTGDIVVIEVTSIAPSQPKELDTVRRELVESWLKEQRQKKNLMAAKALIPDLIEGKLKLSDIANTQGVPLNTLTNAMRTQPELPKGVDRATWLRLLESDVKKPTFQQIPGALLIGIMTDVTLPDRSAINPITLQKVTDEASKGQSNETLVQYIGALTDRYSTRVNDRLMKQMYAPKENAPE